MHNFKKSMLSMISFAVYNGVHYVYCSLFYFTEITDCAFVHYGFNFFLWRTASTYFVNGITVNVYPIGYTVHNTQ